MFKTMIAGFTAIGLAAATLPTAAQADGNNVLRGALAGAVAGGIIAVIVDGGHNRKRVATRVPTNRVYTGNRYYRSDNYKAARLAERRAAIRAERRHEVRREVRHNQRQAGIQRDARLKDRGYGDKGRDGQGRRFR